MATIQEKLQFILERHGASVVRRQGAYVVMTAPNLRPGNFYFLGPSGAFRAGRNKTTSINQENLARRLLAQWDAMQYFGKSPATNAIPDLV